MVDASLVVVFAGLVWFSVRLLIEHCHINGDWELVGSATMACSRRFLKSSVMSSCLHVEDDDAMC